jgi:hypothetical protein
MLVGRWPSEFPPPQLQKKPLSHGCESGCLRKFSSQCSANKDYEVFAGRCSSAGIRVTFFVSCA